MQGDGLLAELRELAVKERQVRSGMAHVVARLINERVAQDKGYTGIVPLLMDLLQIHKTTADVLVKQAEQTGPRRTMAGQPLEPKRPVVAAAMAAGALNGDQFDSIVDVLDGLAERFTGDVVDDLEAELVTEARGKNARSLTTYANQRAREIDQDGHEPKELPPHSGNRLSFRPKSDGGARVTGELDAVGYATVRKVINSLNAPAKNPDGERDERTRPQRDGDALVEAMERLLTQGELPTDGGERPHITMRVDYDPLAREVRKAILDTGDKLSAAEARLLACDAKILPIVMGGPSVKWDAGYDKYRVAGTMRKLLVERDGGCAFPNCDRPGEWCHAHHVTSFHGEDGPSEPHNLCLVCPQHHRLVHASEWGIEMVNGRPWFRPPAFIDPQRRLLFNHHPAGLPRQPA